MKEEKDEHRQRIIAAIGDFLAGVKRPRQDSAKKRLKSVPNSEKQEKMSEVIEGNYF